MLLCNSNTLHQSYEENGIYFNDPRKNVNLDGILINQPASL